MNTDFIKGVIVPIITVIDEEEKINEAATKPRTNFGNRSQITFKPGFSSSTPSFFVYDQ